MDCSNLPGFLEGDLPADAQVQFGRHLVACASCQTAVEAALQIWALGAELSQRPDRPRAVPYLPDVAQRRTSLRGQHRRVAAAVLAIAAILAIVVLARRPTSTLESQLTAGLAPRRAMMERLPYTPLDRYRAYDAMRAGPARVGKSPTEVVIRSGAGAPPGEPISMEVLAGLEKRRDSTELVAALIASGDLRGAESRLQQAGSGDNLDVERAIVAERKGQAAAALALLDQVLARSPRHPQALWNRAVVLSDLDLPLAAAEAFDACIALAEPDWSAEAVARRDDLRRRENERARELSDAIKTCDLGDGKLPAPDFVRRHAALCQPSLYVAAREATTRDEVLRLLPVARAIDDASGNTAGFEMVNRIAALDFKARVPSAALYRRLRAQPKPSIPEQERIVAQLRASGQRDLLLGALLYVNLPLSSFIDELVQLARADHDPYLEELATEYEARAKLASGRAIEAEASLRQAVKECAAHDLELRCAYLEVRLGELYLARHRPVEAAATALDALARSRRVGLYWNERVLFGLLGQAAQLERDYPQMRAYIREAALRVKDCGQVRVDQEALSGAELSELRFASARAELDRAPTCGEPLSMARAQIEGELARFDGTPARTASLRWELERKRRESELSRGERAHLDAIEGRALAESDPAAARVALNRAVAAADALAFDDVEGTKARNLAYRTLLVLGAKDLSSAALLELFAAAGRTQLRAGCVLGAMIDGERLLLLARDAGSHYQQVFELHAFKTPDFDAHSLVPAAMVSALVGCARVDVIALPPLYGQPQLLPPGLAWSYRGPAGTPPTAGARWPTILTVEDTRPPAALELPRLQSPSHAPHGTEADEVILRGAEATPDRMRSELLQADLAEIHAHGFVDLGISDVSLIALSPDAGNNFALTARVIAGLKLPRAPFITLAACDAAYTAPYLHEPWSLPYAFLLAGARGVLAPATMIPDQDADTFFRAVRDQILSGIDPAIVLRDQRVQRHTGSTDWVNGVVLFD